MWRKLTPVRGRPLVFCFDAGLDQSILSRSMQSATAEVGATVGYLVGETVGFLVGASVGETVGSSVGETVGCLVGTAVSSCTPKLRPRPRRKRRPGSSH